MGTREGRRREAARPVATSGERRARRRSSALPHTEVVLRHFEAFGLNGYQARILAALVQLSPATPAQLARVADVHRTAAYPVLNDLQAMGLALPMPGEQGVWITPGRDQVVDRLFAAQEQHLQVLAGRVGAAREALKLLAPDESPGPRPAVQLLRSNPEAWVVYQRLLGQSTTELLILNRPPYGDPSYPDREAAEKQGRDQVHPAVMRVLEDGVEIRVLYEAAPWSDPSASGFRAAMAAYHAAGVQGRIVDTLPMKLVISDRREALIGITGASGSALAEARVVQHLVVEDEAYCRWQADAFEHHWATGRPCP